MKRASRLIRNLSLGLKHVRLNALRSFLTMLGMVFGVGSVVAMLAVGEGASRKALEEIRMLGSSNIIVESLKPAADTAASQRSRFVNQYGLEYQDVLRITEAFSSVRQVVPVKIVRNVGRMGSRELELRLMGTTPQWFELFHRPLLAGRLLTERDLEQGSNVAVLTEFVARALLSMEEPLGGNIRIAGNAFKVVGILRSEGEGGLTPDKPNDVYVPLSVARGRFGDLSVRRSAGGREREMVELHQIIVQVASTEEVPSAALGIEAMLRRFHPKEDYRVRVPLALLRQAQETKRTFNVVLGSIAGVSLLVGGIGIMNIMLASVTERTREIGIRRAIGATQSQIVGQFLIETLVLSTTGGCIGILVGLLIPQLISSFADMPVLVTPWSLVLSLGISMAVGIVFGLYPAIKAARLDPIQALRYE